ncbi:radical SAM protein [uncultured Anaerovibrio sp.]|uniref:radical SAM protein n=1 Tax=uncultured Anaerovibrio sp. TaxID=361586 RepID=UPI00261B215D|nr:radical SAM protein [uncultured Anaerovibrio sp.]
MTGLLDCTLCPRMCHANRHKQQGFCGGGIRARVALVSLHPWEEPVIAGTSGAGTVFFSGCSLRCIFCQNYEISHQHKGIEVSDERLGEIFFEQQLRGAATLDLVTPTHYIPQIINGLIYARKKGFCLPVVYNSSGYENISSLDLLQSHVDVFLPDLKYYSTDLSGEYSQASDYFFVASEAVKKMVQLTGEAVEKNGILQKGVLVRHMVIPGARKDSMKLLEWLWHEFGDSIMVSIMNQYTPAYMALDHPKLKRRLTTFEYESVVDFARSLGFSRCFIQESDATGMEYVPRWTGEGVLFVV